MRASHPIHRCFRAGMACLCIGCIPTAATAGDPLPLHLPREVVTTDFDLMCRVKSAIAGDPLLKNINLMVSVIDGGAVVGGAVASDAMSARVSQILHTVPGITDVKVSCWVPAVEDPLRKMVAARLKAVTPATEILDPRIGATTVTLRHMPTMTYLLEPAALRPAASAYSPVPPPAPPAPSGPPEFPTIPSPSVPVLPKQDVAAAVEAVQSSVLRYSTLKVIVKAGSVAISGTASDAADAWDLALELRKVPGVDRVIVGLLPR